MSNRARKSFQLVLIKPSHYDRDGYVIRWLRTVIPSNTLSALYGLGNDCAKRKVLGEDVEIVITAIDETNRRIEVPNLIDLIEEAGAGLICLVGVQSNQFPRAMDLARKFRAGGIQVCIGGFHISGCLAMLPGIQPDLQEALDLGISLFAGEAEGRFEGILRDAMAGEMTPVYNYLKDLPAVAGAPTPFLPADRLTRTFGRQTSFDAGRGCPFQCSFCTIINVQGRKSRRRSPDDIEHIIRANIAQGIRKFFITDDNFARNKDWEPIFDRVISLREDEGLKVSLNIQVDTLCHQIPNFISKAARAGVRKVFIGLENINPDALAGAAKKQNRISEYRAMLQAWRNADVVTFAGYIIGFPGDTAESIERDIKIIQRELPIDILEFFILTPLPGSADHQKLYREGIWMEPDMNKYDLTHITTAHAQMTADEWLGAFRGAWNSYYSLEHIETLIKRAVAGGIKPSRISFMAMWFHGCSTIEGLHPLDGGFFRIKRRDERRPSLARENPLLFYPKYAARLLITHARYLNRILQYRRITKRVLADPKSVDYVDRAITPCADDDVEKLALFAETRPVNGKKAPAAKGVPATDIPTTTASALGLAPPPAE